MQISSCYQILPKIKSRTYFYNQQNKNRPKNSIENNNTQFVNKNFDLNYYINSNIVFRANSYEAKLKLAAEEILNQNTIFDLEKYKKLSRKEIDILREYGEIFKQTDKRTINFIINFGKQFSQRLQEKYPNSFTFVSVGRSPVFLAKYLEFQGEDVKYCPISDIANGFFKPGEYSSGFIKEYKKYLDSIGLTKEFVQTTKKPIIITDYTYEGCSLSNFRMLLASPEIGITEGEKVKYCPITECEIFKRENWIFDCGFENSKEYIDIMENEMTKLYTSIPYFNYRKYQDGLYSAILDKYYQNDNKFEENFRTKIVNFLIADSIQKN